MPTFWESIKTHYSKTSYTLIIPCVYLFLTIIILISTYPFIFNYFSCGDSMPCLMPLNYVINLPGIVIHRLISIGSNSDYDYNLFSFLVWIAIGFLIDLLISKLRKAKSSGLKEQTQKQIENVGLLSLNTSMISIFSAQFRFMAPRSEVWTLLIIQILFTALTVYLVILLTKKHAKRLAITAIILTCISIVTLFA